MIVRRVAVAPMMDGTDTHCRYFLSLISPHTPLYTGMITSGALIHGDRKRFLAFNAEEHPVALQVVAVYRRNLRAVHATAMSTATTRSI